MSKFCDMALRYAEKGWDVFPIRAKEKAPPLVDWDALATKDPVQIKQWWSRWPEANVGIATGARSGIVVLDVDSGHGGNGSLMNLLVEWGPLPVTPKAKTGGGGWHILFAHPGQEIRNSAGKLGAGLDIRGDGGYIVAAPSIHPSGNVYQWEVLPSATPLAPMPAWLIHKLAEPKNTQNAPAAPPASMPDVVPAGQRNAFITSLAGTMRRRGMGEDAMIAALMVENNARCNPPLTEEEVRHVVKSVGRYSPKTPPRFINQIGNEQEPREPSTAAEGIAYFLDLLNNLEGRTIPTFLTPVDVGIGGLERQTLTILAARPSMGKSTLAWQIARNIAAQGMRSYFFSLEMSTASLWAKAACGAAGVSWKDIRAGKAADWQIDRVIDRANDLMVRYGSHILVDDGPNTSEMIFKAIEKHQPDFVVVDHLRLVTDRVESEVQRLGIITQRLKDAAKTFNCSVMCLAQLNREVESRDNKRPQLSDLRDSGQIEENADVVLMMYRSDYYDDTNKSSNSETELLVRKFRDGDAQSKIVLRFDKTAQWFRSENDN